MYTRYGQKKAAEIQTFLTKLQPSLSLERLRGKYCWGFSPKEPVYNNRFCPQCNQSIIIFKGFRNWNSLQDLL